MLKCVTTEDTLSEIMDRHMKDYFWNRVIVTGVSRTGKSTFMDAYHEKYFLKAIHSPNFEMSDADAYMFMKYGYIIDRWYPWDRFVYGTKPPIIETYTHNILPVIFVRNQFEVLDRDIRSKGEVQRERYWELAEMLDKSGKFEQVVMLT